MDSGPAAQKALGSWGLGTRRSLEQYAKFSGVDTIHRTTQNGHCRMQYVPWASDAKHTVYSEYRAGGLAGKVGTINLSGVSLKDHHEM